MKKIFTLLCMALIAMAGFNANAFKVTVLLNDPDHVAVCEKQGDTYPHIEYKPEGVTFEGGSYDWYINVYIDVEDGYVANYKTFKAKDEEPEGYTKTGLSGISKIMVTTTLNDDMILKVDVKNLVKDGKIKLTIDGDLNKLSSLVLEKAKESHELKLGEQTIEYCSDFDDVASIMLADGVSELYRVIHNGKELKADTNEDGEYLYRLRDINKNLDNEVTVETDYPDVDFNLSVTTTEGCEDFFTVWIDGEKTLDYAKVHAGKSVSIKGDVAKYRVDDARLNGTSIRFIDSYSFVMSKDMNFVFDVAEYQPFTVTVNVDNASAVNCSYKGKNVTLSDGANTVNMKEDDTSLKFVAADGFKITSLCVNGSEVEDYGDGFIAEDLAQGYEIDVETDVRQTVAVTMYCNDEAAAWRMQDDYFFYSAIGYNMLKFTKGYSKPCIYKDDNTYAIESYADPTIVYVNNALKQSEESDIYSATFRFKNGDVIKVYGGKAPEFYNVAYELTGIDEISVTRDYGTEVANATAGHKELPGTQVAIAAAKNITDVTVNDVTITPTEEGCYEFFVNSETIVKVTGDSGVETIGADIAASKKVYNLQGVLVSEEGIQGLPAGLYITGSHKILVK